MVRDSEEAPRQLLSRLRAGESSALEELTRCYGDMLSRAAYVALGDSHAAADVAQDTLVAAWQGAARTSAETQLRSWLLGILFNLCRKHQRSLIRRRRRENHAGELRASYAPGAPADDRELEKLRHALLGLSDELRNVIVLRYLEKLDVAATASVLSIPTGTVKSRTSSALARLRRTLGRDAADSASE